MKEFSCVTAKEIWKTLLITHQGNSQVKDNKIDLLVQQYEQFIISEDESIDSAFARFNTIITSLKALDEGYSSKNYVRKFLRALHPKWRAKVTTIEESKDLTSLSLDELIGNLKVHEMIIKKDSKIVKAKVERKSLALKAKKESSDEECSTSGSELERDTMVSRDDKNGKRERKCFRCGDPNHLIGECPKPLRDTTQRAFVRGSWSNSSEEDDEKVKDETCLVAHASSEVCSESSYFSDENSSIGGLALDNDMISLGFNSFEASSSGTKEIKFVKAQKKASPDGGPINMGGPLNVQAAPKINMGPPPATPGSEKTVSFQKSILGPRPKHIIVNKVKIPVASDNEVKQFYKPLSKPGVGFSKLNFRSKTPPPRRVNNNYSRPKTPQPKRYVGRQNQPHGFPVYTWSRFLKDKIEAFDQFKIFSRKIQNQLGCSIVSIRIDHGREFDNEVQFGEFCNTNGITHNFLAPRTPQSNGVVDRKNRTLQEMSRTILNEQSLPQKFWCNAVDTSTYISNRFSLELILGKSPLELVREPKNVNEALGDESCIVAMQEELNQFVANDVWELVPQPRNMTIIGTKWVFRNKLDENGIVSRNKARCKKLNSGMVLSIEEVWSDKVMWECCFVVESIAWLRGLIGEFALSTLDVLQRFSFFLQMGFTLILATLDGLNVGLLGDVIGGDDCDDDDWGCIYRGGKV
ncbi:zf-CCHC domain-containing protein [Tanacetum coccineum]